MNTSGYKSRWRNYIGDATPPPGYELVAMEHGIKTFYVPTNVAYGVNGKFVYKNAPAGSFTFSNETFGKDPYPNADKGGFAEIQKATQGVVTPVVQPQPVLNNQQQATPAITPEAGTEPVKSNTTSYLIIGGVSLAVIIGAIVIFRKLKK